MKKIINIQIHVYKVNISCIYSKYTKDALECVKECKLINNGFNEVVILNEFSKSFYDKLITRSKFDLLNRFMNSYNLNYDTSYQVCVELNWNESSIKKVDQAMKVLGVDMNKAKLFCQMCGWNEDQMTKVVESTPKDQILQKLNQ